MLEKIKKFLSKKPETVGVVGVARFKIFEEIGFVSMLYTLLYNPDVKSFGDFWGKCVILCTPYDGLKMSVQNSFEKASKVRDSNCLTIGDVVYKGSLLPYYSGACKNLGEEVVLDLRDYVYFKSTEVEYFDDGQRISKNTSIVFRMDVGMLKTYKLGRS